MKRTSRSTGFIQTVIMIILGVAALAYFNVDVRGILANPSIQKLLAILVGAWTDYLVPLGHYLWTGAAGLFPAR